MKQEIKQEASDEEDKDITLTKAEYLKMRESMRKELIREFVFEGPRSAMSEKEAERNFGKTYNSEAEARLIEQAIERNDKK